MDKKTISYLKQRFPRLFRTVIQSPILSRLASEMDRGNFVFSMMAGKPYFGTVHMAGQTWEERRDWMRRMVEQEVKRHRGGEFRLLEVGSWAGQSAVLWANAVATHGQGMVLCVDPWEPYIDEAREKVNSATIIMNQALRKNEIFKLFLHNIKASGHEGLVRPIKGRSDRILPLFKPESFDVVYVDGDHSFSGISKDLKLAGPLVKDGGVLCGDDLDLTVDEIDREYAERHKETNAVVDPKQQKIYHPGVSLAVAEYFKQPVSRFHGFWAMRKMAGQWQPVELA